MEDRKEKILDIRNKLKDFNKFILEYGFNDEKDIFIKEELDNFMNELDNIELEIKNDE